MAELARAQDIGEADVVWDLAAGLPSAKQVPVAAAPDGLGRPPRGAVGKR